MKKSTDIAKMIAEKKAVVQATVELATKENRELTGDEKTLIDGIQGIGDQAGELQALKDDYDRAVRFEARVGEIAGEIGGRKPETKGGKVAVKIPATARVHGNLRAFTGKAGGKNAYVFGRSLAANLLNHGPSKRWLKENGMRNALSEDSNEKGGVFVPIETKREIIRLAEEFGVFRQYAMPEPMGSDTKTVTVRTGGMTAYPVAETNTANESSNTGTQSEPAYTTVELVARKWKAWVKMSDEINEDSIVSLADQVAFETALAFAYAEDNAGFNGTGDSATYHGIVGVLNAVAAGSIYTAVSGNTAFSTLDLQDFITMKGKLPRYPGIRPAWFISPEGYCDAMERLLLAAGGNAVVDIANGGVPLFLGSPVVLTNVLNSTLSTQTSTNLLAYGDLRMAALFGDRRRMTMSLSDQRYWDSDQIAIKATERFDIAIHSRGTASAPGAILVLQTPAS